MRRIKRVEKSVCLLMAMILLFSFAPVHSVLAAMIGTESILRSQEDHDTRDQIRAFLERKDVQYHLTTRGIDPVEARARVDSLSDAEVNQIAGLIDQLPAGGDFWGTVLFLAIIGLVVLVVLELLGYTDFI